MAALSRTEAKEEELRLRACRERLSTSKRRLRAKHLCLSISAARPVASSQFRVNKLEQSCTHLKPVQDVFETEAVCGARVDDFWTCATSERVFASFAIPSVDVALTDCEVVVVHDEEDAGRDFVMNDRLAIVRDNVDAKFLHSLGQLAISNEDRADARLGRRNAVRIRRSLRLREIGGCH